MVRPVKRRRPAQGVKRAPAGLLNPRTLKWVGVVVAAVVLWIVLSNHVFLIRNVKVNGADSVPEADVVRLSGIKLGSRLSALNTAEIRDRVESTGRLAFVDIRKRYPTTVELTVRERSQDAVIMQAGKLLVLDSAGYVVSEAYDMPNLTVPFVQGIRPSAYRLGQQLDDSDGRVSAMGAVLEALKTRGATDYVSEVNVESVKAIKLLTRKNIVVLVGNSDNMQNKIIWMVGAIKDLEARGETSGQLDVSSGNKADFLPLVTVRPTPIPTQETFEIFTPTLEPTPTPEPIADEAVIGEDAI